MVQFIFHFCSTDNNGFRCLVLNQTSNVFPSLSGVPKGGHLSPILSLLFVISVQNALPFARILCFADDMKIYLEIKPAEDCLYLQNNVDYFSRWCKILGLKLNLAKYRVSCPSLGLVIQLYGRINSLILTLNASLTV